jgi:hypothetical protein
MNVELINQGIEKVFDEQYEEAREFVRSGSKDQKSIGDFLTHWIMLRENDPEKIKSFEKVVQKQISQLENGSTFEDVESHFMGGLWNGLMALYLVKEDRMLSAYKYGRRAYEMLRNCLMLEPEKYDAYYGLGLYHKMKYELGGSLWFVPNSPKDEKIAKKYFNLALKKGIFTRELSKFMLIELSV